MRRTKMWTALAVFSILILPMFPAGAAAGGAKEGSDEAVQGISGRAIPKDTNPHLYHAECAARYFMSIAVEPSPGQYKWYKSDLKSTMYCTDITEGAGGIGMFFIRLYEATGNATYLKYAEGAAKWVISLAVPVGQMACKWPRVEGQYHYSYDKIAGAAGMGEFLLELYKVTHNSTYLNYSKKAARWLMDTAIAQYGGYKWQTYPGSDYNFTGWAHGVAGICDFFRQIYAETGEKQYLDYADGGARWLMAIARFPAPDQCGWVRIETDKNLSMSWCGGTTGIVMYFIYLHQTTGNETYLDYARRGGNWMIANADSQGTDLVCFEYLNMYCHGDPSDSLAMFMLYNETKNETYKSFGEKSANWIISTGEPVGESAMRWPTWEGGDYYMTTLLRGVSGIGTGMLSTYKITGEDRYLGYALKAAHWVENQSVEVSGGVEKWSWGVGPEDDPEYTNGWYEGMAGIGFFLLDMVPFWTPPVRHGVEIVEMNQTGNADPGEMLSYSISVRNSGNVPDGMFLELTTPVSGWLATAEMDGTNIAPNGVLQAFVNITVPKDALFGARQVVTLTARSAADRKLEDSISITTIVNPVYKVEISGNGPGQLVEPGASTGHRLYVENNGNAVDCVGLELSSAPSGWAVTVAFNGSDMAPGTSREAVVDVRAPADALADVSWTATGRASSAGDGNVSDETTILTTVSTVRGVHILDRNLTGQARPGEAATYSVAIRNTGNSVEDIIPGVDTPAAGWNVSFSFNGARVAPGQTRTLELKITPPQGALAGKREFAGLMASSGSNASVSDRISVSTTVLPVTGVDVFPPSNTSALPGSVVKLPFCVFNRGNLNGTFVLACECAPSLSARILGLAGTLALGPFQNATIVVEVTVPSSARAGSPSTVKLKAVSSLDLNVSASATSSLEVLPVPRFSLTADAVSLTVQAGGRFALVNLTLNNTGNVDLTINCGVSGAGRSWVAGNQDNLSLAMGAGKLIALSIAPPKGTKGSYVVEIAAAAGNITQTVRVNLTVVPVPVKEPRTTVGDSNPLPAVLVLMIVGVAVAAGLMRVRKGRKPQEPGDGNPTGGSGMLRGT